MSYHVGIDLGGTRIKTLAVDAAGRTLAGKNLPNEIQTADAWRAAIRQILCAWEDTLGGAPTTIGLCAPGLAARDATHIAYMPGRMQALEALHWATELGAAVPVRVLNDAHAALLGEVWHGAARDARDAVLLTLGTGVGGAILCDGHLLRGAIGRAGHLGHLSLDPTGAPGITRCAGPLEDVIGNHSLRARSNGRFGETTALVAAVSAGDVQARDVWHRSVTALGAAIVSIVNAVDPAIVILGGGIADAGDALFEPLRNYLDAHEWRPGGHRVSVVRALLGDTAGALGAARFGMTYGETN